MTTTNNTITTTARILTTTVEDVELDRNFSLIQQIILFLTPICSGFVSTIGSSALLYMIFTEGKNGKKRSNAGSNNHRATTQGGNSTTGSVASDVDNCYNIGGGNSSSLENLAVQVQSNNNNNNSHNDDCHRTGRPHSRTRRRRNHYEQHQLSTFQRIMVGLSTFDMINSIRAMTSTLLLPVGTPGIWHSFGNTTTCAVHGFFGQLGFAASLYSTSLSVYFLLSVRPTIRIGTVTRIEPIFHAIPIVFTLSTAIAGVVMDSFNPIPLGITCWVAAYPWGCADEDSDIGCTRGANADMLLWLFGGGPLTVAYIIIILSMTGIYTSVRNQVRKMEERYGFTLSTGTGTSSDGFNHGGATTTSATTTTPATETSTTETPTPTTPTITTITPATPATPATPTTPTTVDTKPKSKELSKRSKQKLQMILNQAILYISVFFLSHIWMSIGRIMEFNHQSVGNYIIMVLSEVFYPMQGFFNFLIYVRPRYIELRTIHPELVRLKTFKIVLGIEMEPKRQRRRTTTIVKHSDVQDSDNDNENNNNNIENNNYKNSKCNYNKNDVTITFESGNGTENQEVVFCPEEEELPPLPSLLNFPGLLEEDTSSTPSIIHIQTDGK